LFTFLEKFLYTFYDFQDESEVNTY
jgi:hypothetical protein